MAVTLRREVDVETRIFDVLKNFVGKKFNGVTIAEVKNQYDRGLEGRRADVVVLKDDGYPLLIIETKKKYEKPGYWRQERRFHVMSEEVLGQVFSYAAILKRNGIYVPFIATANDSQIAVFSIPEDIDKMVNWIAIENREYGKVLSWNQILKLRENRLLRHERIRFTEDFFANYLDIITGIYVKKYGFEERRQEFHWVLIEDLRGFVDTLASFVLDAIAPGGRFREDLEGELERYSRERGYMPTPEQLAREMSYVLLNKMLFHKILERHYKLEELKPLYLNGKIKTVNEYLSKLNELFENAVRVTGDFEPVFRTGIYDRMDIVESEEVLKLFDWLINLIDHYKVEKLGDIIGYVYEDLIPGEERHQLGQFYTSKPIAELIVKWAVRSTDDKVLDPGCGSGTFLIETYKRLAELKLKKPFREVRYVSRDVHEQILRQLYGIDINEFPAHLTVMNLAMRNPKAPSAITQVIVEDFFNVIPGQRRLLPYKVRTAEGEKQLEIVFKDFDAVVGNPPYTRWGELPENVQRNVLTRIGGLLEKYDLLPTAGRRGSEYNMVVFWIMHATQFLRDGGRLGMIVSDSWLQAIYGIRFARFLLDYYKVVAVIDIATRVFDVPLIGACIILLERELNELKRMENNTIFVYLHPRKSIDMDKVLKLISEYRSRPGDVYSDEDLHLRVVPQKQLASEQRRWIEHIFTVNEIMERLQSIDILTRLSTYFEPTYGNTLYTILYTRRVVRTRHAGVGGEEFFYLTEDRASQHGIPPQYLYPLLPSSRLATCFTFTKEDWDAIRRSSNECYLFLCHAPRNQLPQQVLNYIRLGETTIMLQKGIHRGQPVSMSRAADERRRLRQHFFDWYDLGGVVEAPIFVSRGAQYWIRFILARFRCALDDRILALIPRQGVSFDEVELKALLAYLNSSFGQLQAEVRGRSTGGGMIELDVKTLSEFLILDVKRLARSDVEMLAQLFDRLEAEARRLGGADEAENIYGSDLARELTGRNVRPGVQGLFNTVIKEIDHGVGRILGLSEAEVEAVRTLVIGMARRRLSRAGEARPEALRGSEETPARGRRGRRRGETSASTRRLDEFFNR